MMEKIKIGILGGSINSAVGRAHVAAIRLSGRYDIVAGFMSKNLEVNKASAQEYGIPMNNTFDSIQNLMEFSSENNITILICTPTNQHIEQVEYGLEMGINIICEKALSDFVSDAMQMRLHNLIKKAKLSVIYNYTSYPAIRYIRNLICEHKFGKVLQINASMPQESFIKKNPSHNPILPQLWRLHDGEIPTISLDLGVHLHSLVKFLIDEQANSVFGIESNFGNFQGVVDDVKCFARYDNDILVNYWYSKVALGHRNGLRLEIYGSEGSAIWEHAFPEQIHFTDFKGEKSIVDRGSSSNQIGNDPKYNYFKPGHPTGFIEALSNYYIDIYDERRLGNEVRSKRNVFGLEESLEGLIFLKAIHNSNLQRNWISIKKEEKE